MKVQQIEQIMKKISILKIFLYEQHFLANIFLFYLRMTAGAAV